ncbi:MFS transporter [soil metagenome]
MSQPERSTPWYVGITRYQWLVFMIASAGWVFDVFEGQLFAIFKTPALVELLGYSESELANEAAAREAVDWHANAALALFLVGGAVGGLGFGILADRIGRVKTLAFTILVYSIFSALTFFAQEVWHLHALRFLVALGVGGEWAVAAALVAETFGPKARTFALGTFHTSSVLGVALAASVGVVLASSHWRWGFLLGITPALLVFWVRLSLKEPEGWRAAKLEEKAGEALGSLSELLGDARWRSRALIGLGLASVGLASYWGIHAWAPELVVETLDPARSIDERRRIANSVYLFVNCTGSLLGLLCFAPLAAWKGRRAAFAIYHVGAFVMVPLAFLGAQTFVQAVGLLSLTAFFVVGMHAGYAIYFPELFPTRLRATGGSFCFNVGRLLSGVLLLVRGTLRAELGGLRPAVAAMALLFLVGLVLLAFAPETKGKDLPE